MTEGSTVVGEFEQVMNLDEIEAMMQDIEDQKDNGIERN